jgi:hypothetical protein
VGKAGGDELRNEPTLVVSQVHTVRRSYHAPRRRAIRASG